jgi:hypothetical protein
VIDLAVVSATAVAAAAASSAVADSAATAASAGVAASATDSVSTHVVYLAAAVYVFTECAIAEETVETAAAAA